MSPVKLGFAVWWPAFWTAVPFKLIIGLLFLAMGVHPWEFPAIAFLLLLSIPIDIWAMGVSARTVFLERLRLVPPDGLGLTVWWQSAILNAIYLPLAYYIQGAVTGGAKAASAAITEIELLKTLGVAERITLNLVLWGSVASIVLIILVLVWLYLFGRIVKLQASKASPASEPYQGLVRTWDLSRVPADQPLMLTVFTATGVMLVICLWAFMPRTTPHPHEGYKKEEAKKAPEVKPAEVLKKTEKLLAQAETSVQAMEAKVEEDAKTKEQDKGKGKGKDQAPKAKTDEPKAAQKPGDKAAPAQSASPKPAGK
jgi:hypothetical protein